MKTTRTLLWVFALVVLATACKNKDAEKKIAALEARISELEGKKSSENAITPETAVPAEEKPEGPLPVLAFETMEHDFGTINEGDIVEYTFKLRNTGDAELVIQNAQPSCGCTVPNWTKDPIPAGGEGFITAKFDSKGKTNIQNKTITVTANTYPKTQTLRFKAMVTPAAK